jgi:hypothetical protein
VGHCLQSAPPPTERAEVLDPATLTAFLAPFLPALVGGAKAAAEEIGQRFGAEAWERAQTIWSAVRGKVDARPAAQEAVADVAKTPDSEGARASLTWQLEKLLAEDDELARRVRELWDEGVATKVVQASGAGAIAVGDSADDATFVTGNNVSIRP